MAAMQPSEDEYLKTGVFYMAKNRIVWLLVLMLSATLTGRIIQPYNDLLQTAIVLAAYYPMLMSTGGNCGSQASTMVIRGRYAKSGIPRELTLSSTEICEVLHRLGRQIADEVLSVLEDTSAELVGDIAETGIVLTGGSSQLWGMDLLLQERIGISCTVADDPASCVAYGCGKSLSWITKMTEGPANIARKRLMRK